jgi:hypothetical protein
MMEAGLLDERMKIEIELTAFRASKKTRPLINQEP